MYCFVDDELIVDVAKQHGISAPADIADEHEEELCPDVSAPISWSRFYDAVYEWKPEYAKVRLQSVTDSGGDDKVLEVVPNLFCGIFTVGGNYNLMRNTIWNSGRNREEELLANCYFNSMKLVIPNLTRNIRPYAFIENVVTHSDYRGKGYATECLNYEKQIAENTNCYKTMLLTGLKKKETLNFYGNAGYNSIDKPKDITIYYGTFRYRRYPQYIHSFTV